MRPLLKDDERMHFGLDERNAWGRALRQIEEARAPMTARIMLDGTTVFCLERCMAYWRDRAIKAEVMKEQQP